MRERPYAFLVDADCLIAGVLTSEGATSRLIDRWQAGDFELIVCPQLVHEVKKALLSPRLAERYGIRAADAEAFATRLSDEGIMHPDPVNPPRTVPDDPGDDYLVALALASGTETLVTRDRHFDKVDVQRFRVISPRAALESLDR